MLERLIRITPCRQLNLRRLQSRLAVTVRLAMQQTLARDVVSAYLGAYAGTRVLAGQIQRGDGEDIDAVIWFSDLRSSTRLAESLGTEAFLELLNRFFECTAGTVQASNGEILDYIGDSVLAIFPFAKFGGPAQACRTALAAANLASTRFAAFNEERQARDEAPLGFGLGEEIVVSEVFRNLAGGDWRPLGTFELRNVNQPMLLFAPNGQTAAS